MPIADVRPCKLDDVTAIKEEFGSAHVGSYGINETPDGYEDLMNIIKIDPDKQLSNSSRQKFYAIYELYSHLFTNNPVLNKMDHLIDYGMLIRPESIEIIPKFVSPSKLVPKPEPGENRYIMDFTQLNTYIRKYPAVSPTIYDTRKALAKKKYRIEMDLSNFSINLRKKSGTSPILGYYTPLMGLWYNPGNLKSFKMRRNMDIINLL